MPYLKVMRTTDGIKKNGGTITVRMPQPVAIPPSVVSTGQANTGTGQTNAATGR